MQPKVIVLILSYNGRDLLNDAISNYLSNSYENFEVVVIDNGSSDNTKSFVESNWPKVKVLRTEKNLKYSGGLNFGLEYAFKERNADYALITNNDVIADRKIISSCVEVAEKFNKVGFVVGKVFFHDSPNIFQTCGREWHEKNWRGNSIGLYEVDNGQHNVTREIAWCDDIFWLVNRKLYDLTGGYNTEFAFQAEDFEWQVRAKKLGYKIYFTPEAKLWHKESITIGKDSPFKAYYNFRNPLIVHMMHRSYSDYRYYYRMKRNSLIVTTAKSLFRMRIKYIFNCWQGFFSALKWGLKNKKISIIQIFKF